MDTFGSNFYQPVRKTSIQYKPLLYAYPIHHTGAHAQEVGGGHRDTLTPSRHFHHAKPLLELGNTLSSMNDAGEENFFTYLSNSINKLSISNRIWSNTYPVGLYYKSDEGSWDFSEYYLYFANLVIIATCVVLYTLQILYFQDLKICRDFDNKFKPLSQNQNVTLCSFLNQCSLKTPIANEWRLQEYAWLRIVLSTIQYIPFLFLFTVDWIFIRYNIQLLSKSTMHYSGVNKDATPTFQNYNRDVNFWLNSFNWLMLSCCLVVGCVLFALDYEAQRAAKDCIYNNMPNGKNEPENWAFFLPGQKAPSDLPLVFLIFGSFFTFWTFNFLVYSTYKSDGKMKKNSANSMEKAHKKIADQNKRVNDHVQEILEHS